MLKLAQQHDEEGPGSLIHNCASLELPTPDQTCSVGQSQNKNPPDLDRWFGTHQ